MPIVKDLISDYVFRKAHGFDALTPHISVILPTYRRAQNGLFRKAVETLLRQDFKNIELIIVDDCSTDGTQEIIAALWPKTRASRRSDIKKNVGQPAISVNLGIFLSRGQKILCAFDDNEFSKTGIARLAEDQNKNPAHKISYGQTVYHYKDDPTDYYFGKEILLSQNLQAANQIGHSATLVDREVYEKIGLYDMHIGIVRFWDWDFWTRANLYFDFHKIDCVINEEKGMLQADSLGNSFSNNPVVVQEIMHTYRNKALSFADWQKADITEGYPNLSLYAQLLLKQIAASDFKGRFGVPALHCTAQNEGYILMIAVRTGCVELGFDVTNGRVLFIHPDLFWQSPTSFLPGAKAVIFPREVYETAYHFSLLLTQMKIPYYFFTDDNLFCEEYVQKYNPYNGSSYAMEFLRNAKGIIAGTPPLAAAMRAYNDNTQTPPMVCTLPLPLQREYVKDLAHFDFQAAASGLKIGYISSGKIAGFIALKQGFIDLQKRLGINLELYCWVFEGERDGVTRAFAKLPGLSLHLMTFEYSYPKFCIALRKRKFHFLIHVSGEILKELYPYKTYNYLITACFANAVPLVTNRPPYDRLKESEPQLAPLIPDTAEEVIAMIEQIVACPELADHYLTLCKAFVDKIYPIAYNQKVIDDLLRQSEGPFLLNAAPQQAHFASSYAPINTLDDFMRSFKSCQAYLAQKIRYVVTQGQILRFTRNYGGKLAVRFFRKLRGRLA